MRWPNLRVGFAVLVLSLLAAEVVTAVSNATRRPVRATTCFSSATTRSAVTTSTGASAGFCVDAAATGRFAAFFAVALCMAGEAFFGAAAFVVLVVLLGVVRGVVAGVLRAPARFGFAAAAAPSTALTTLAVFAGRAVGAVMCALA